MANVLGSFSKGADGSVSINFGTSGGSNCSKRCIHHPDSKRANATRKCYAAAVERRADRVQLHEKLKRHERMTAARLCGAALLELQRMERQGKLPPWVRFSTNGSLPMPSSAGNLFLIQLRSLVQWIVDRGIPVHLPVESHDKAEFYREAIGDLVTVRESLQTPGSHTTAQGAVSWVAGADITGKNIRARRIERARQEAKERREATGRKAVVCPAVCNGWKLKTAQSQASGALRKHGESSPEHNETLAQVQNATVAASNAKCGNCIACSLPSVDIVYPLH